MTQRHIPHRQGEAENVDCTERDYRFAVALAKITACTTVWYVSVQVGRIGKVGRYHQRGNTLMCVADARFGRVGFQVLQLITFP